MEQKRDRATILEEASESILAGSIEEASALIEREYPFEPITPQKRTSTADRVIRIAVRDGFIDRYSGKKLVNPGLLRSLSTLLPNGVFPFTPHWSMRETHAAYWELTPTLDHVKPIARGGRDAEENIVITSMMNNSIKSNWLLSEMNGWFLHEPGDIDDWNGLSATFLKLVETHPDLLDNQTIRSYHRATAKHLTERLFTA